MKKFKWKSFVICNQKNPKQACSKKTIYRGHIFLCHLPFLAGILIFSTHHLGLTLLRASASYSYESHVATAYSSTIYTKSNIYFIRMRLTNKLRLTYLYLSKEPSNDAKIYFVRSQIIFDLKCLHLIWVFCVCFSICLFVCKFVGLCLFVNWSGHLSAPRQNCSQLLLVDENKRLAKR